MADRIKKLAGKNPRVDEVAVRAARAALRQLRKQGVEGRSFELLPAFGGNRPAPRGRKFRQGVIAKLTEDA